MSDELLMADILENLPRMAAPDDLDDDSNNSNHDDLAPRDHADVDVANTMRPAAATTRRNNNNQNHNHTHNRNNTPLDPALRRQQAAARISRAYFWFSFYGAILAIATEPSSTTLHHNSHMVPPTEHHMNKNTMDSAAAAVRWMDAGAPPTATTSDSPASPTNNNNSNNNSNNKRSSSSSLLSSAFFSPARQQALQAASAPRPHVVATTTTTVATAAAAAPKPVDPHPLQQLPLWLRRLILLPDEDYYFKHQQQQQQQHRTMDDMEAPTNNYKGKPLKAECSASGDGKGDSSTLANTKNSNDGGGWWNFLSLLQPKEKEDAAAREDSLCSTNSATLNHKAQDSHNDDNDGDKTTAIPTDHLSSVMISSWHAVGDTIGNELALLYQRLQLDPTLLHPSPHTLTDVMDKLLTSLPRLLALTNFLLVLTYWMHKVVAEWFLGGAPRQRRRRGWDHESATGREKLGGYLVFKLLLVSAVLAPDTLDLLILLTWYTGLSFGRSLAHLSHHCIQNASAAGQAPEPGVLHLLLWIGLSNVLALCGCVALFHTAGWSMVLLLTCDCFLTACDVLSYMLQYFQAVWEVQHAALVAALEEEELQRLDIRGPNREAPLGQRRNNQDEATNQEGNDGGFENEDSAEWTNMTDHVLEASTANRGNNSNYNEDEDLSSSVHPFPIRDEIEERIHGIEERHNRCTTMMETAIFCLQLLGHFLTVGHFMHIWLLHGVQFTLIDGVLALHLHSAISSASKKIAQRRNLYRIARDLDGVFPEATEMELRKAALCGDVCCVCLSSMTSHVKKVACGHLYHTSCLREVVERARTMEAARCPLCRASVLNGHYHTHNTSSTNLAGINNNHNNDNNNAMDRGLDTNGDGDNNNNNNNINNNNNNNMDPLLQGGEDHALFRISTDGIFPSWIPIPAFSFEVVRRTPPMMVPQPTRGTNNTNENEGAGNEGDTMGQPPLQQQQQLPQLPQEEEEQRQPSFLRRLLVAAGALPMTPQEEAAALEQLVDMFPQYDRADLLQELRRRSSSEAVAESILSGSFSGVPR